MKKIVVTGGCGYIGSHTIISLIQNGFEVVSIDNLSKADKGVYTILENILGKSIQHYEVDCCDKAALAKVFEQEADIDGVIHFAAYKSVGESVVEPLKYYQNNIQSLVNVLECCHQQAVSSFIFSSSCTVYGQPDTLPVTENTPLQPAESPYGATKQMGETIIRDFSKNAHTKAILLRYFNPVGGEDAGRLGQVPLDNPENLVPIVTQTAAGIRANMTVFGNDYDTRDGSCLRDYIHVMDLADAHTKALIYSLSTEQAPSVEVFNLGIGEGATVLEILHAFEQANNVTVKYSIGPRRPGDIEKIYSNYEKAKQLLDWTPKRSLEDMMRSAWLWEQHLIQTGYYERKTLSC